jgi:alpha-mannosidase
MTQSSPFSAGIGMKSPFVVQGAPNVFLETIKRGEDDDFTSSSSSSSTTIILRLYEAFGGHAHAQLRIASHLPITSAKLTNFLEDEEGAEVLNVFRADDGRGGGGDADGVLKLEFRAFEVKSVKLVVGGGKVVVQE